MFINKFKRKLLSHPRFSRGLIIFFTLAILVGVFSFLVLPKIPTLLSSGARIILNDDPNVLRDSSRRTNVLLLGTGGENHDGSNLTDTIIVVSAVTKFDDITTTVNPIILISIPRDIYIESIDNKINAAYEMAGLPLAKELVGQITGLQIHYAVRIDFSVFEKVIDTLGGIDVNVLNTLDDYAYPIVGKENDTCGMPNITVYDETLLSQTFPCRFEHLHFDPGLQHMDGKTALKFARSRHAQGDEGTDFARSKRQQLVIKAVKDKIFASSTFLNISKDIGIYNQIKANIETDFDFSQPKSLFALGLKYRNAPFKNIVLDETLLINPPIDSRGWFLLPNGGNWDQIHTYISSQSGILKQ